MAHNKDTDYQALIEQAVLNGDYSSAARYEQSRNEKIADLNASGTNTYNATPTNNYSQYLQKAPAGYSGSATGVGIFTNDQKSIQDQMNQNSLAWWDADDTTKAALEAANRQLAAQLGSGVTFDSASGTWSGMANRPISSGGFSSSSSKPSFDYDSYMQGNPQPTYTSDYASRIDALLNQILNREEFSYEAESDPLYQQYKEQYNREGNRSMNDTLASVAANAGGMNSYAVTAAQQANDYYATKLADKIPELYQLAYDMYLTDIDQQVRDLGLLQDMEDMYYGRYRDNMGDWYNNRDFNYGMYRDNMGDYQWQTSFDYNQYRDAIEDGRYEMELALSQQPAYTGSPDGGGGSGYDNNGYSEAMVRKAQEYVGATPDGKWGKQSQAAADSLNLGSLTQVIWDMNRYKGEPINSTYNSLLNTMSNLRESGASDATLLEVLEDHTLLSTGLSGGDVNNLMKLFDLDKY